MNVLSLFSGTPAARSRALRHRLAVEVAPDELAHEGTSVALADDFAEALPELGVGADDAGGFGVSVGGAVLGHAPSIGGGLPPRLVPDMVVDIHHRRESAMSNTRTSDDETSGIVVRCKARGHVECSGGSPDGLTRRCRNGDHERCPGSWTSYPDHEGPCECPHHRPTKKTTCCTFCHRAIFEARNGAWYHRHNASASCRPGWTSNKATPGGEEEA